MRENLTGLHSLHLNQTEPLWDVRIRQKKEARKYVVLKGNSWRKIVQRISSTVILVSYTVGYKKSILDTQIVSDFEYLIIYSTRNNQKSQRIQSKAENQYWTPVIFGASGSTALKSGMIHCMGSETVSEITVCEHSSPQT